MGACVKWTILLDETGHHYQRSFKYPERVTYSTIWNGYADSDHVLISLLKESKATASFMFPANVESCSMPQFWMNESVNKIHMWNKVQTKYISGMYDCLSSYNKHLTINGFLPFLRVNIHSIIHRQKEQILKTSIFTILTSLLCSHLSYTTISKVWATSSHITPE